MPDGNPEGEPEGEGAEFHAPEEPTEVTPERTRESEIKANVEFWGQPYWQKFFGSKNTISPNAGDVKREFDKIPETEGMDFMIYVPEKVEANDIVGYLQQLKGFGSLGLDKDHRYRKTMPHLKGEPKKGKAYAQAICYQQESEKPREFSEPKTVPEWEPKGGKSRDYITPTAYLAACARWFQKNGTHLDEKSYTIFPYYQRHGNNNKYPRDVVTASYDQYRGFDEILLMGSRRSESGVFTRWVPRKEVDYSSPGTGPGQGRYRRTELDGRNNPHYSRIGTREAKSSFKKGLF